MSKKALTIALLLLSALPAAAELAVIPCAVGNKWEFDTVKLLNATVRYQGRMLSSVKDASYGKSVYEVTGVDSKANPPVYDYKESTNTWPANGGAGSDSDSTELKISNDDKGLRILSSYREGSQGDKPDRQTYDPGLLYYVRNVESAKTWEVGEMRDGDTKSFTTGHAAGRETVTVPAGTFKDCLKVVYSSDRITGTMDMWDKTWTMTGGKSRGIYWIAEGVGVVKELEVATSVAETPGMDGKPVTVEASSCTVSELKPGWIVKK